MIFCKFESNCFFFFVILRYFIDESLNISCDEIELFIKFFFLFLFRFYRRGFYEVDIRLLYKLFFIDS